MSNIKLGSHVSFKAPNYLQDSMADTLKYSANAFMIFLGPPQSSKRVDEARLKIDDYLKSKEQKIFNYQNIVVHAPYIINLANPKNYNFNLEFMIKEIKLMNKFKLKYLVLHPGSKLKAELKPSLDIVVRALKEIIQKTSDVIICLETMSGKGSEICSNLEEIEYIIKNVNNNRVQICLDTCHLWDAGYDIKNKLDLFLDELKKKNLIDIIPVIHVNDSKNDLGSHKDRHANIDKGFIGFRALQEFIYSKQFSNAIFILETPWVDNKPIYKKEIEILRKRD